MLVQPPLTKAQKTKLSATAKKAAKALSRLHTIEQEYLSIVGTSGLSEKDAKDLFMNMVYEADKEGYVKMFIKRDRIE